MASDTTMQLFWTHENLLVLRHMLTIQTTTMLQSLGTYTDPVAARVRVMIERNYEELEWINATIDALDARLQQHSN